MSMWHLLGAIENKDLYHCIQILKSRYCLLVFRSLSTSEESDANSFLQRAATRIFRMPELHHFRWLSNAVQQT